MIVASLSYYSFHDTAPTEIYTLSLHDALPISGGRARHGPGAQGPRDPALQGPRRDERVAARSEEHTSELQSRENLVCRLLLEKKNSKAKCSSDERACGCTGGVGPPSHRDGPAG